MDNKKLIEILKTLHRRISYLELFIGKLSGNINEYAKQLKQEIKETEKK